MKTLCIILCICSLNLAAQDWPQWRGPDRNGVAAKSPVLATTWVEERPPQLWEAKILPREGGEGSPVVAAGKVYIFANEPRDLDVQTRTLDDRFYQALQWFDPDKMPAADLAKMEQLRLEQPADLKGKQRKAWMEQQASTHFTDKNRQRLAQRRMAKGSEGVSPDGMRMLAKVRDRTFGSEAIFLNWLDGNEVSDDDRENILRALPDTKREAKDVIFCVDANNGNTLWDTVLEGRPESRIGSSTPAVVDGSLYVLGTTHAHALDALSGEVKWSSPLPQPASASSPLVTDTHVIGLAGVLAAYKRDSGELDWTNESVKGRKSSPLRWNDKILVNAESTRRLMCIEASTGKVIWDVPGGGDSTPALAGDIVVLHIKTGVVAYRLHDDRAEELWQHAYDDTRGASSPVILGDQVVVYPTTGATCFDLQTGNVIWEDGFKSGIISPIFADGKLIQLTNGGQFISFRDPASGDELAKTRSKGSRCASAALANGMLVLRTRESVVALDLKK